MNHLNGYHVLLKLQIHLSNKKPIIEKSIDNQFSLTNKKLIRDILDKKVTAEFISKIFNSKNFEKCKNSLKINKIINVIEDNFNEICLDEHGCCYIQRTIDSFSNQILGAMIINKTLLNLDCFLNSNFSNYILQNIINLGNKDYNDFIFLYVKPNFLQLSLQEHSSKVIDSLVLYYLTYEEKGISFLSEFVLMEDVIEELIFNKYGFIGKFFLLFFLVFVNIIRYLSPEVLTKISHVVESLYKKIMKYPYKIQLLTSIMKHEYSLVDYLSLKFKNKVKSFLNSK